MGDFVGHPFRGNQWTEGGTRFSRGDYLAERAGGSATTGSGADGSAPTPDDNPTGTFSEFGKTELRTTEEHIRGKSAEVAQVLDARGRSLLVKTTGSSNSVSFTAEEASRMEGGVLTHNHPNASPFSTEDVKLAVRRGLREIRAVGSDGSLYRLGTTSGWTPEMFTSYEVALDEVTRPTFEKIRRGEMTVQEANAGWPEEAHAALMMFAKRHASEGVYYKRVRGKK